MNFTLYRRGLRCPTGVPIRRSSAHFIHDAPSSSAAGPVHRWPRQPVGTLPSHRTNTPRPFGWRNLEKKNKTNDVFNCFFFLPSVFIPRGYWCKSYRGHVYRVRYSFRRSSPSPVLVCLLVFFSSSRNFSFLFLTFYTTNAPQ